MLPYFSINKNQQKEMLKDIGFKSFEDVFKDIPDSCRYNNKLDLPKPLSEIELREKLKKISKKNININDYICFRGGGAYDHYIPSAVDYIVSRQEFYTAYTPYQAEISQGTLQAIFEYQTYICELTGMDASNASMYDGPTALAEACIMAITSTRRKKIIVSKNLNPQCRHILNTYLKYRDCNIEEIEYKEGVLNLERIKDKLDRNTAAVVVQNPNFFGIIEEEIEELSHIVHSNKSLLIGYVEPISLGLLKPPGKMGVDIAVGEGQSLGNNLNYGGPYFGFLACSKKLIRKIPGRIVGKTKDLEGNGGYVLTMQTREQHIRREKATSNICSNQALNALRALIYLSLLGKNGFKTISNLCLQKAYNTYKKLIDINGIEPYFNKPFFKEFIVRINNYDINSLNQKLKDYNIIGGYPIEKDYPELKKCWLIAVTEKRLTNEIEYFTDKVGDIINV